MKLAKKVYGPAIIHLDLDVLDDSVRKVNGYESPDGLLEHELIYCLGLVPMKAAPSQNAPSIQISVMGIKSLRLECVRL